MTSGPLTSGGLAGRIAEARARLDAHVREVVAWHFDPATGCPFWLERAGSFDFDPARDVRGYDDLELFGLFRGEWLRGGPVRRWLPRGLRGRPFHVFETGGTTGIPKYRVSVRDHEIDYEAFSLTLDDETFPPGADWLMLGPTGPRRLRLAIEHLAHHRGGTTFHVDCDPRWVRRLRQGGRWDELELYKDHVVDQAVSVLSAHEVRCLFTTPKLLEGLARKVSLAGAGVTGIFCGGTEITSEFLRLAREELAPGADLRPVYGNTLMGLATAKPFDPATGDYTITYFPPLPRAVFEIVDPNDAESTVGYGETGRVLLTTLTREFFLPRLLERDQGERAEPIALYPWDGVSSLRPCSRV
jgi:hypothetical protein